MAHLSDLALRNLKPPAKGQIEIRDDLIPGLSVRVSQGGTKTFTLVYGTPRKRVSIGRYPVITIAQAREKCRQLLAHHTLNGDAPPPLHFNEAVRLYLTTHGQNLKLSTRKETERLLTRHFLFKKPINDVTTHDIMAVVDDLKRSEGNHAFTAVRALMNWAEKRRLIRQNPVRGLKLPNRAVSRSRVLSDAEIGILLAHAPRRGLYGQIIQLLLYTGQRLSQITNLNAEWIQEDRITWPAEAMKGNREHSIPIGPRTRELLAVLPKPCTFNNWSTAHSLLLRDTGLEHFTRHDLRRVYATVMARWTLPHVLQCLLAHRTGPISGIHAIYNRHTYWDEMNSASLQLEEFLHGLA
jgi:integrase